MEKEEKEQAGEEENKEVEEGDYGREEWGGGKKEKKWKRGWWEATLTEGVLLNVYEEDDEQVWQEPERLRRNENKRNSRVQSKDRKENNTD